MWFKFYNHLPTEDTIVDTKIDDKDGCRNEQKLKFCRNVWWLPDMSMYVYYSPTHWKYVSQSV